MLIRLALAHDTLPNPGSEDAAPAEGGSLDNRLIVGVSGQQRSMNRDCPVLHLPTELLIVIFEMACVYPWLERQLFSIEEAFRLLRTTRNAVGEVCRHWRTVSIDTHSLIS